MGIQPYLFMVRNTQQRFYLTRLRFGTLHFLIAFPKMGEWCRKLLNCPCDGKSRQSTLHFLLFCNFYRDIRKFVLKPLFLANTCYHYKQAFNFIHRLESVKIMNAVISFIQMSIRRRKDYSYLEALVYEQHDD